MGNNNDYAADFHLCNGVEMCLTWRKFSLVPVITKDKIEVLFNLTLIFLLFSFQTMHFMQFF